MRYGSIRVFVPVVLASLAGCANYDKLRETAPQASTYELCRAGHMNPDVQVRSIAFTELQRRNQVQECGQYANAFAQERAANSQDTANAISLLRAAQPAPIAPLAPIPQPVYCTSTTFGSQVQTTCR